MGRVGQLPSLFSRTWGIAQLKYTGNNLFLHDFTPSCRGREGVAPKERGKGGMHCIYHHFRNDISQLESSNNIAVNR